MIGLDLTIQLVVMRLFAGLIIATVQGAAIAAAAVLLGDKGPRYDKRLTVFSPRHIDLLGLGSMILSGFGWGKAVAIDAAQLRIGRLGLVIAVLAGSAALLAVGMLILWLIVPLLTVLPYTAGITTAAFIRVTARLCVWTAILALVPLPPLAGAHFLSALGIRLPQAAGLWIGIALLVVSALGITRMVLTPLYDVIAPLVLGVELAR